MIRQDFIENIETELRKAIGSKVKIEDFSQEFGGDINESLKVVSNVGDFFIKINEADAFPKMFDAEAKGLALLNEKSSFVVPKPIVVGEFHNKAYLLLEYLPLKSMGSWESFGEQLAKMHCESSENFGLDYSNYIGSLVQENKEIDSWSEFYTNQRLLPLSTKAFEDNLLNRHDLKNIESLYKELPSIYPIEKPSLLHGDLWSGNASFCKGHACVYDPAVYFGHREMDIGMTLLFGGFPNDMYEAYNATLSLEKGWQDRVEISQLYPLLVHVNLFGGSYVNQLRSILRKFG